MEITGRANIKLKRERTLTYVAGAFRTGTRAFRVWLPKYHLYGKCHAAIMYEQPKSNNICGRLSEALPKSYMISTNDSREVG
jgi:hypothetical protein